MKHADIQRIHDAGLISEEQRLRIIGHFGLQEDSSRFLAIMLGLGAVLASAGIVLMVASNWEQIPPMVKLASGLILMVGAYAGGWLLRDQRGDYPQVGEALYLVGAGMFLANIALVGQIYNLSSRFPNAILLWWVGIAGLPWILRSRPLHIVSLLAFGFWFGSEVCSHDGWFFFDTGTAPLLLFAALGLIYHGWGTCLRRSGWSEFAPETENLGLLGFLGVLYLLTIGPFTYEIRPVENRTLMLFGAMAAAGLGLLGFGLLREPKLTGQWRLTWIASWTVVVGLMVWALLGGAERRAEYSGWFTGTPVSYGAILVLFVLCLILIQVGVILGRPSLLNFGVTFVALDVITTYLTLIGSMARTGLMFLISGVFLIAFGFYLEKKRRSLLRQLKAQAV